MPMSGPGEVRKVAQMKDGIDDVAWSPDGRWIGFTSHTPDERYEAEDVSWQSPRKIEHFVSRMNGEDWIFDRPNHVYVVAADGITDPRNLTPGSFQHGGVEWLHDSSAIITSAARHEGWDFDFCTDLYRVGLDGEVTALTNQTGDYSNASVSPDGTQIAFIGFDSPLTYPQNVHVGVLPVAGAGADRIGHRWISRGLDRTFYPTGGPRPPVWLDDATLLSSAEDRGQVHLFRLPADGSSAPEPLTSGARTVYGWDAKASAKGTTIVGTVSEVNHPAELYNLSQGQSTRLSSLNDAFVDSFKPRSWERFAVATTDGSAEIDAWIMRPDGFVEGESYPVLLNVHGGPHTQYGELFFDEAQMQAKAGFVVLMSNPRGSSGREEAWGQAIIGPKHPDAPGSGWGSVDVDDVLAVLDAALDRYHFCDRQRVGMLGGSYGGYMATMLAGLHGERFRGICSERSVNNLLTEEANSDIATFFAPKPESRRSMIPTN